MTLLRIPLFGEKPRRGWGVHVGARVLMVMLGILMSTAATALAGSGPAAPAPSGPPSIGGYPQQGVALSATPGSWVGSPSPTFAYQWLRCTSVGIGCAPLAGATAVTYTPVAGDVGQTLEVAVTATNSSGSENASSVPSATVRPAAGTIIEYKLPSNVSTPSGITRGPDGNVWFTTEHGGMVGKITSVGVLNLYSVAPAGSSLGGIGTGPDGNIWFTDYTDARVERIAPTGTNLTLFPIAGTPGLSAITGGADGNIWFAESQASVLGRISPTGGGYTTFPTATSGAWPHGVNLGPDGNLWFVEVTAGKLGAITPSGSLSEWKIKTANSSPRVIATGIDGNLWFTEFTGNRVGRITPAGAITEFSMPAPSSGPVGIVQGQDGYVWFTEQSGDRIARITTSGSITEFPVPTPSAQPDKIVLGADGNLWFTELAGNAIGMVVSGPPVSVQPANTVLPVVSGVLAQGQTLHATQGSWSGFPVPSYSYQWNRCNQAGAGCVAIAGASSNTYTLSSADTGARVQVRVVAAGSSGTASVTSTPTAAIAGPPAVGTPPTVSGLAALGQLLTVVPGTWGGFPAPVLTYQWLRCDQLGVGCSSITGATESTYVLGVADVGWTLEAIVTGSNAGGVAVSTSGASPVVAGPPVPTVPTISGVAVEGQTLTVTPGAWGGVPAPALSYQWLRCDQLGGGCSPIPGSTESAYVLSAADVGETLEVSVTGINGSGNVTSTSVQTALVSALAEAPVPAVPTVSGIAVEGQTLTVEAGGWGGVPAPVLSYQWLRCDQSGGGCVPIQGAIEATYSLTTADVGATIEMSMTGTNATATSTSTSVQTPVVSELNGAPVPAVPRVSGVAIEGQTLMVEAGGWGGVPAPVLSYQWSRCDQFGGGCTPIPGATASTYSPAAADVDGILEVSVTGTNVSGTATSSVQTPLVITLAEAPVAAVPAVSGVAVEGHALTVEAGAWGGLPTPALSFQWLRCDQFGGGCAPVQGANESAYVLSAADVGATMEVSVTGTNATGTATSTSVPTSPVSAPAEAPVPAAPTVSGMAAAGQTLTAAAGSWGGVPTPALVYQWLRCDQFGGNCSSVQGGAVSTYTLTAADVGATLEVSVTGTNAVGTVSARSAASSVVAGPPVAVIPAVAGVAAEGQTLTAMPGGWNGYPAPELAYQWLRCDQLGAGCTAIPAAATSTYTPTAADVGGTLEVSVTGSNANGTAVAASAAGPIVVSAAGPLTPVLDEFNRANNTGPPSSSWKHAGTLNGSASSNLYVLGNQATGTAGTDTDFWNGASFAANSEVFLTVANPPTVAGDFVALGLRMQNPAATSTSGYQGFYVHGTTTPDEYKIVLRASGTSDIALVSTLAGPRLLAGDKLLFRAIGSTLELWVCHTGTWSKVLTTKSSAISSGGYLMLTARNSAVRLDDFGGGTLP